MSAIWQIEELKRCVLFVGKSFIHLKKDKEPTVLRNVANRQSQNRGICEGKKEIDSSLATVTFIFMYQIIRQYVIKRIRGYMNIALSWKSILDAFWNRLNWLDIRIESDQTTALKILNYETIKILLTAVGIVGCIRLIILSCRGNNIKALPNTGWLWRSILEGILSLMSWFTTRMVSEMITGLKTLNCGLRDIQTAQELIKSMLTRFQTYVNELPNLKESWQN